MSWNNKVELVGSLGAEPEVRFTQSGRAVMNFRIATSEKWKDQSGAQKEKTDWHSCVVWGDKATEYAEHLHKGSYVRVEGKLETSSYDDQNGQKRYKTEIIVSHVAPAAFPKSDHASPPAGNQIPFGAPPAAPAYGGGVTDDYGDINY